MDSDSELKDNLAEIVNKEKLALRVDVTYDVKDGKIDPKKCGSSSTWTDMEDRLSKDMAEADEFLARAKEQEDEARRRCDRYFELHEKRITPVTDLDKKIFTLSKEKIKKLVKKMANQRKQAYSGYNYCKKQMAEHLKLKQKDSDCTDGKLIKINGRYFQWWEGLPAYLRKHQPQKECTKTLYRRIREMLIINPTELEHDAVVQLMDRYR